MILDEDSQRSGRWLVMFGHLRVVDRVAAPVASLPRLRFDGSMMKPYCRPETGSFRQLKRGGAK